MVKTDNEFEKRQQSIKGQLTKKPQELKTRVIMKRQQLTDKADKNDIIYKGIKKGNLIQNDIKNNKVKDFNVLEKRQHAKQGQDLENDNLITLRRPVKQ